MGSIRSGTVLPVLCSQTVLHWLWCRSNYGTVTRESRWESTATWLRVSRAMLLRNVHHASLSSRLDALRSQKRMKAKLIKIIGWTVGVAVGVFLIVDGKMETFHPLRHALIGAAIGLVLGLIFSRKTKATSAN